MDQEFLFHPFPQRKGKPTSTDGFESECSQLLCNRNPKVQATQIPIMGCVDKHCGISTWRIPLSYKKGKPTAGTQNAGSKTSCQATERRHIRQHAVWVHSQKALEKAALSSGKRRSGCLGAGLGEGQGLSEERLKETFWGHGMFSSGVWWCFHGGHGLVRSW